jgi:delta 1-pyrroline-5-carboxylate dehydrogenase
MLGEGALTDKCASKYLTTYIYAIISIAKKLTNTPATAANRDISIKLIVPLLPEQTLAVNTAAAGGNAHLLA